MTYIALARKWRPRTFSELLGQEHLTRALTQSLQQNRVHHAYLFTGTRGVGKTSVARILAKALNCEQGMSAQPCLQCDHCQAIEHGRFIDLIEIDAASKTRVEDTREVLDNVQYAPTIGRFKIYLIDEVHMLSQHSFNALLKTLEEPPAHVKFLLATTDVQKLPVTILSRCLQFHLKHVSEPIITAHLQTILQDEHIAYETQALAMMAKAARGSMRDALSLLDQSLAGRSGDLSAMNVAMLLGQTTEDYAIQFIQALIAQDPQQIITISRTLAQTGGHFRYVLDELLAYLHRIAIVQALPNPPDYIEAQPDVIQFAQQLSAEDTQLFYQIGLKGLSDLPYAPSPAIGFEMILLRMYTFKPASTAKQPKLAYQDKGQSFEIPSPPLEILVPELAIPTDHEFLPSTPNDVEPTTSSAPELEQYDLLNSVLVPILEPESPHAASSAQPDANWEAIINQLSLSGLALTAIRHSELLEKIDHNIILKVEKAHQSIFTKPVITRIQDSLSAYYQETVHVTLQFHTELVDSPAAQKKTADTQQQTAYTAALHADPVFQQLQKEFSADLVKDSIVATSEHE